MGANQGHLNHARALHAGRDAIKTKGGRADDNAVLTGATETAHQQINAFITAASSQHLIECNAVQFGEAGVQRYRR
jgi:hypothetical protein